MALEVFRARALCWPATMIRQWLGQMILESNGKELGRNDRTGFMNEACGHSQTSRGTADCSPQEVPNPYKIKS